MLHFGMVHGGRVWQHHMAVSTRGAARRVKRVVSWCLDAHHAGRQLWLVAHRAADQTLPAGAIWTASLRDTEH